MRRFIPTKACPVLVRDSGELEVLAFRHPLAGLQLVKGTIEPGEEPGSAALRELREEAGIENATIAADLGIWTSGYADHVWSFHLCQVAERIPDRWSHHTADDGGHDFEFFWHSLSRKPSSEWHAMFVGALAFLHQKLAISSR